MRAHLLDRQILDATREPVGVVDDVVFDDGGGDGPPRVAALLTGRALIDRILGDVPEPSRLTSVDARLLEDVGVVVSLSAGDDELGDVGWVERWTRDHVVARIPGSRLRG
nr:hypothetical protein [Gordonia humi]